MLVWRCWVHARFVLLRFRLREAFVVQFTRFFLCQIAKPTIAVVAAATDSAIHNA
jgi:hypothetical protein